MHNNVIYKPLNIELQPLMKFFDATVVYNIQLAIASIQYV